MELIRARFRVITPMFLGENTDVSQNGRVKCADGIRGASVKGALRAIWRALNWSRLRTSNDSDATALRALHLEESRLFGKAAKTVNGQVEGGQSAFLLRVVNDDVRVIDQDAERQKGFQGSKVPEIQYLLGMGLFSYKEGLLRGYIDAGSEFTLELALKPSMTDAMKKQLLDALQFFGLAGNLGSRARKGFGSVSLLSLHQNGQAFALPATAQEYTAALKRLMGSDLTTTLPPLTAFSQHTSVQLSSTSHKAINLLKEHGHEMGMERSFGSNAKGTGHKTFDLPAEQNFTDDHDLAYAISQDQRPGKLPERAVFGLPHPYRLSTGAKVGFDSSTERRASRLFAHIQQLPSGECLLIHMVFKSVFLPKGATVNVKKGRTLAYSVNDVDNHIDWSVLDNFLNRFTSKERIHG